MGQGETWAAEPTAASTGRARSVRNWPLLTLVLLLLAAACGDVSQSQDVADGGSGNTEAADASPEPASGRSEGDGEGTPAALDLPFPPIPDDVKGTLIDELISNTRADEAYTIGLAVPNLPDPVFQSIVEATQLYADEIGIELRVVDAGGYTEVQRQVSQVEDLVQAGVEGILLGAVDAAALGPAVAQAADAGVPVVDYVLTENSGRAVMAVLNNQEAIGRAECEGLARLQPNARVVMLSGPQGADAANRRAQGFRTCAEEQGMEILREQFGPSARDDALRQMEDMIQAIGPEIQGVYTFGSYMALGAADAVDRAGLSDQIAIATSNPSAEVFDSSIDVMVDQRNFMTTIAALAGLLSHLQGNDELPELLEVPVVPVAGDEVGSHDWGWTLMPDEQPQ